MAKDQTKDPVDEPHESVVDTVEAKRERRGSDDDKRTPKDPTDLAGAGKKATLKRTVKEFSADQLTDTAAALTYYGVLALFPALIALVSILGLVGPSATQPLIDNLSVVAPGPAKDIITSAIENLTHSRGAAGFTFVLGLVLALNAASGYIGAFSRAMNRIYEVEEGRPIWKLKPVQIGTTLVLILLLVAVAIAVTFTGPLAEQAGNLLGLGDTAVTVWSIAKWPVILIVVSVMISFLYWAAPNVKQPGFKWVSPGGILALVVWIIASLLFALYVSNFASYNKTYAPWAASWRSSCGCGSRTSRCSSARSSTPRCSAASSCRPGTKPRSTSRSSSRATRRSSRRSSTRPARG
jgi:membrane protein